MAANADAQSSPARTLPTERPPAGAFPTAEREAGNPHDCQDDGSDPEQMNRKPRTEENQYQKSQQEYCHNRSPFLFRVPESVTLLR